MKISPDKHLAEFKAWLRYPLPRSIKEIEKRMKKKADETDNPLRFMALAKEEVKKYYLTSFIK